MEIKCAFCSNLVTKPLHIVKRALENSKSGLVFCSRSCSAKKTNTLYPKKKAKTWKCRKCSSECAPRRILCDTCSSHGSLGDITLREAMYTKHHKSAAFSLVRSRARAINKDNSCKACGYSKHVEVAHIKPISSFPEDTLLSKINDPQNLIALCPNCHWEFDHGLLNEQVIAKIQSILKCGSGES
jgi:hypothetical protein